MKRARTLDLNDIIQHPGRPVSFDIQSELPDFKDIELMDPIDGTLIANNTGSVLLVNGDFTARFWVDCSRCALRFAETVPFSLEEQFELSGIPGGVQAHSSAQVIQGEEPYPLFKENNLLIDELIHQHLVINLPIQTLCKEDCQGLCPNCGVNLNEGPHECVIEAGHPAFNELADKWRRKKT